MPFAILFYKVTVPVCSLMASYFPVLLGTNGAMKALVHISQDVFMFQLDVFCLSSL